MIKIKKIIFLVLLLLICLEKGNTEISDSLFLTVGNKPITRSDIVNEIKILLILNDEIYSEDKRVLLPRPLRLRYSQSVNSPSKLVKLVPLL